MHYIGKELKTRMDLLNMNTEELCEMAFMEEPIVRNLLLDKIALEELEPLEFEWICSALHCDTRYFTDEAIRRQDLLYSTVDSSDTVKSIQVKSQIQTFIQDMALVTGIEQEA